MKDFLEAGKIVGTHGVRGMVRIQPWCDTGDFLCGFKKLYIKGGEEALTINKIQPHGNVVIAAIKGVDSIELAEKLRGSVLFIKRSDVSLPEGQYFIDDIIGCEVFDVLSGEKLGVISDVSPTGANDVWHILNATGEYLVPVIDEILYKVDIDAGEIFIIPMKGIFDDEN